jgi:hypothetical protein
MASLEERVSRVEGVIDQMNERLGNLEQGQRTLLSEVRNNFRWTLGITIAMWITIVGAVIGALLAN